MDWTADAAARPGQQGVRNSKSRKSGPDRARPGDTSHSEEDYLRRPEHDTPEIVRVDLSQLLLSIRAMNIAHLDDLDWLNTPPKENIESAELLLDRIGANKGMEQRLARFPCLRACPAS